MKYQYTLHDKQVAYEGFFKIDRHVISYEKFSGGFIDKVVREGGRKGGIVSVVAFDPRKKVFLMVEQFRIGLAIRGAHPWSIEIVSGFIDKGENPEDSAKRELFEETGCEALTIKSLASYFSSPGSSPSKHDVFLAEVDADQAQKYTGIAAEGEDICVHKIALADAYHQLISGRINNATSMIGYYQFFLKNNHLI